LSQAFVRQAVGDAADDCQGLEVGVPQTCAKVACGVGWASIGLARLILRCMLVMK